MSTQDNNQGQGDSQSSSSEFERITPAQINPQAGSGSAPVAGARRGLPAGVVWLALALLLLVAGAIFFWLPLTPSAPQLADTAPETNNGPAQTADAPAQPAADAETLLAQRAQAQELAAQLVQLRQNLADRGAELWAAQAYTENGETAAKADALFQRREYLSAQEKYEEGVAQASALLEKSGQVLAKALKEGAAAYADENSASAVKAYELALAIEPGNAQATKGLARARSLDSVLEKMQAGQSLEDDNDLSAAREQYQVALKLDDEYQPARVALQRVQAKIAGKAFNQQMSRGLAALDRNDHAAAKAAFAAALKLRSADGNAADGLAQANNALQRVAVGKYRQQAEAAASQERWQQALDAYQAALRIDPALRFAQRGEARAKSRLQLDQALQGHLDNPQRLSDAGVQSAAESALGQAGDIADAGPRLKKQRLELARLLAAMRTPVPVHLRSDNNTQVLVYHVGDLGRFESRKLELTPGEYTVVGRCVGYRDVRRIIDVKAQASSVGPITIRCEEKI